jgi:hypothetical protein
VGYFDDFSNEEDMAKYKEVYDKQIELSRLADRDAPIKKSAFVGFTFRFVPLLLPVNKTFKRCGGKEREWSGTNCPTGKSGRNVWNDVLTR